MARAITPELNEWIRNYRGQSGNGLPVITTSFFLKIEDLRRFIDRVESEGGTFLRGYFVRFTLGNEPVGTPNANWPGSRWQNAGNGLTQVSFAFVPVRNYRQNSGTDPGGGDDFLLRDAPFIFFPGGESTGLCPTNCGGSAEGNDS